MKLRIKVDGKSYEVEIESVEPSANTSAASRVEGSPVGAAFARHQPPINASPAVRSAPSAPPPAQAPAIHHEPRSPWHGLTVGAAGEVLAPTEGIVCQVLIKVGDAVKASDPLVNIEVSHVLSPQKQPLIGTIRAIEAGIVAEIGVEPGQSVKFGQRLVRLQQASA